MLRRYLWIAVSAVLPLAFIVVMKTRPPTAPGEEIEERMIPGAMGLEVQADQQRWERRADVDAGTPVER